jgi:hypothetical protein
MERKVAEMSSHLISGFFDINIGAAGYQLYERIVNEYYASVHFSTVRNAIKDRR